MEQPQEKYENKKLVAVGVVAAALVLLGVAIVVTLGFMNGSGTKKVAVENSATELFYDSLANGAKQSQYRVAMYRATYANKADADAHKNVGTEASSVAEVDIKAGKARSVFATNVSRPPEFSIGRCIDNASYADDYGINNVPRPTTLQAAADALKANQHLYRSHVPVFDPCPRLGFMQDVSADLASFRLSDGVFPVTLTAEKADAWKQKVKKADLFTIKDEGKVEYQGRQLKKISFVPKNEMTTNDTLYTIYRQAAEIDKIKQDHPEAAYEYEFIAVNPGNTGGVGGYYFLDEGAKLPVYSEIYGTNKDREGNTPSAKFNIARTKQTYSFGKPLSLALESPLEILE